MLKKILLMLFLGMGKITTTYSQVEKISFTGNYKLLPNKNDKLGLEAIDLEGSFMIKFGQVRLQNKFVLENYQVTYPFGMKFNTEAVQNFKVAEERIDIGFAVSKKWQVHGYFITALVSNFEGSITSEDFLFTGGAYFLSKNETNASSVFKIGAGYETYFGKPDIYPLFSYYKKVGKKMAAEVGFPKTELTFTPSEQHALSTRLDFQGKFFNISKPIITDQDEVAQKARISTTSLSLMYKHILDDNWSFNIGAGYFLDSQFSLLKSTQTEGFQLELKNRIYFNSGIKLKL